MEELTIPDNIEKYKLGLVVICGNYNDTTHIRTALSTRRLNRHVSIGHIVGFSTQLDNFMIDVKCIDNQVKSFFPDRVCIL